MEYIIKSNGKYYNSFTKEPARNLHEKEYLGVVREDGIAYRMPSTETFFVYTPELKRIERKHGVEFFRHLVTECFEYDVEVSEGAAVLTVYKGTFEAGMKWVPVYVAKATPGKPLAEEGDGSLKDWHFKFIWACGYEEKNPANIHKFEHRPHTMRRLREVFPCELAENAIEFFVRFSKNPKYKVVSYPPEMFSGVSYPKIRKDIGKAYDSEKHNGEIIHYAWQSEVVIQDKVFLDVVVISGFVTDGVMDVESKHRFFLAEDFVYSPDGGDFGVFGEKNFFGKVVTNKFRKQKNKLMLERYTGPNVYKYMFSRYFVPAFEIVAKAGLSKIADILLQTFYDEYYDYPAWYWAVNYFGTNDKEIFGFKLKCLRCLPDEVIEEYAFREPLGFGALICDAQTIAFENPSLFALIKDVNLFKFIYRNADKPNVYECVRYLESIGTENYELYIDYLRMCEDMGRYADGQGRYPKNLRIAHDAMVVYMNEITEANDNKDFAVAVSQEEYRKYIFVPEGEKYCILAPRTSGDLVYESYKLSHCVRSYVGEVAAGRTKIYFLRKQRRKATPLVTVEVLSQTVVQARGRFNRKLENDEMRFLVDWAKANALAVKL